MATQPNPFDQFDAHDSQPASVPIYGPAASTIRQGELNNQTTNTNINQAKAGPEIQKLTLDAAKTAQELKDTQDAKEKARSQATLAIREVLGKIHSVYKTEEGATLPAVGYGSETVGGFSGTAAHNLRQDLATINANTITTALQQMREASKTGGALGNVSEGEERMLANTLSNLTPTQSREQWVRNLGEVKDHYLTVLRKLDPAAADELDKQLSDIPSASATAKKDDKAPALPVVGQGGSGSASGGNGGGPSGGSPLNNPEMRGGLPVGTKIEWNGDAPEGPFDRGRFLKEHFGIDVDQEAKALAFLNGNLKNPNLTPDAIKGWYAQNGIPAPSDADVEKMAKDAQNGRQFSGIDTTQAEDMYRAKLQGNLNKEGFDPTAVGSYGDRVKQGMTLGLSDELQGVGSAIGSAIQGHDPANGYVEGRDTARLAQEQEKQKQGLTGNALEFAGGLVPAFLTGGEGSAGAMRSGAALGGIAGYGYGNGTGGSVAGGVTGMMLGGALGKAGGKLAERFGINKVAPSEGADVINAADRLNTNYGTNIQPIPADVSGDGIRNLTGAAGKLSLAASPISKAARNVTEQAQAARDAIAATVGNATVPEAAGEAAINGARTAMNETRSTVNALYDKAEQLGGTQRINLVKAREVLDKNIEELAQTPGGAQGLQHLKDLRAELDKSWPINGVRNMRTQLRDKFMADGLSRSDIERRVGQVLDAADEDITNNLVSVGKGGAADAYKAASQAHRERMDLIENVMGPIIGDNANAPRSGEQIMNTINSLSQQNNSRLARFLSAIPNEDASTIRATVISRLGKASNGTQNAEGDAFSLPQFLTHWNTIGDGAKKTLFGPQLRAALNDLAKVAEGTKAAQKFQNFSNTGAVLSAAETGTLLVSNPMMAVVNLAGQYGLGRALASPSFARWLAKVPSIKPSAMPAYVTKLSSIASENSAIAADVNGLQNALLNALGKSPVRAGATPSGQDIQN